MTEDWELDFHNPPRIPPPPSDPCDYCGDSLPVKPVYVSYSVPGWVMDYRYCSDDCRYEHKMFLMRSAGF